MQVTIYVDDDLIRQIDERARKLGISRSRCVQMLLRGSLAGLEPVGLMATWGSIPELDSGCRSHLGEDTPREALG